MIKDYFVETLKLLAVTIDHELNLTNMCYISKIRYVFSAKFKEIITKTLLLTHFVYCSTIFKSINLASFLKLENYITKTLK